MKLRVVKAKSVLNPSKVFDYCLNPYTGCAFGCRYCYARLFIPRYSGHREPWGDFVDVKVNAPELLRKQLKKAKKGTIWVSSVCDPYQPIEAKTRLTRRLLTEVARNPFPLNIQTKSDLVLRDLDLFLELEDITVGTTITTEDEAMARHFEPNAPPVKRRLRALRKIHEAGLRTFVFIGPLLPGSPEKLVDRLEGCADHVFIDRMNYAGTLRGLYRALGCEEALEEAFFQEMKQRFVQALSARAISFEVLF
ncbi:MAG: radical SAM protein [Candidatus Aminicenantales bacterium]